MTGTKYGPLYNSLEEKFTVRVFAGCKNSTNEDDGNSISKLDAPTNLVINSITDNTTTCAVNITFNYSGKTGIDGATKAVLGYSTANDSSQAIYDENINYATIESGANTRTVNFPSSELYSGPSIPVLPL